MDLPTRYEILDTRYGPVVTLLTDFGLVDAFPGIMKGVILGICPQARIVDLTHSIPAQQILPGAMILRSAVPFFPPGSVHLAIVDPGVGSSRRALVVETDKGLLIGPDNGLLSLAADALGPRRIFEIQPGPYTLPQVSQTFHGRDIFAAVAAHLAAGVKPEECGSEVTSMQKFEIPAPTVDHLGIEGQVIHIDQFGNLITNIGAELLASFSAQSLSVTIGSTHIRGLASSYASVPVGEPLAIVASWGTLEVAVRNGNAAQAVTAKTGSLVGVVGRARQT